MSYGGMHDGLGLHMATPTEHLEGLERQLDGRAARGAKSKLGHTPEIRQRSNSASKGGSSGSQPINIQPNKPVKITVGFGAGSFTKKSLPGTSPNLATPKESSPQATSPKRPSDKKEKKEKKEKEDGPPREYTKKPKLSKAERRELQEKQRAAKAAQQGGDGADKSNTKKPKLIGKIQADDPSKLKQHSKKLRKAGVPERQSNRKQVELFSHLRQSDNSVSLTEKIPFSSKSTIHPAIVQLGLRYAERQITGSTARCIAMFDAFKEVIHDYKTPPGKEMARTLNAALSPLISFLAESRPLADSMGNAIKHLKHEVTKIDPGMPEEAAKEQLIEYMDKFVQERILLAQVVISESIREKIQDGDVILIHGCSALMLGILKDANDAGIQFRVIVVDSRPRGIGENCVSNLVSIGIRATFVLMNSISYIMKEASKVFLTAHALLANGYVMGRVGTSVIAMMARAHNVPVLVACETYKFSERVQTDSFVFNELDDPVDLLKGSSGKEGESKLKGWTDLDKLKLLNLVYDVTPPEFVDMVVTDIGMVPCTSVPVVLRVKEQMRLD